VTPFRDAGDALFGISAQGPVEDWTANNTDARRPTHLFSRRVSLPVAFLLCA
jgi:hypothetical protein